jgi:aminoglycoside 6'-N-acetyltransferase I
MVTIRHVTRSDAAPWLSMRCALWPEGSETEHREEIERFLAGETSMPLAVLIARDESGQAVGFAELSIRPYAEDCVTDRVAFLEGWYVGPQFRRRGIARALVEVAEQWAIEQGCTEFASDALVDNEVSAIAHAKCGFQEVAVIRCFKKRLSPRDRRGCPREAGMPSSTSKAR